MKKITFILLFGLIIAPIINLNSSYPGEYYVNRLWNSSRTTKAIIAAVAVAVIVYNKLNSNNSRRSSANSNPNITQATASVGVLDAPSVQTEHPVHASSATRVVVSASQPPAQLNAVSAIEQKVIRAKGTMHVSHETDEWGRNIWNIGTSSGDLRVKNIHDDGYSSFQQEKYPIDMLVNYFTGKGTTPYVEFISTDNNAALKVKGTMHFGVINGSSQWYIINQDDTIYIPNNLPTPQEENTYSDYYGYRFFKNDGYLIDIDATFLSSQSDGKKILVQLEGYNRAVQPQASAPVAAAAVASSTQPVVSQDNAQIPQESEPYRTSDEDCLPVQYEVECKEKAENSYVYSQIPQENYGRVSDQQEFQQLEIEGEKGAAKSANNKPATTVISPSRDAEMKATQELTPQHHKAATIYEEPTFVETQRNIKGKMHKITSGGYGGGSWVIKTDQNDFKVDNIHEFPGFKYEGYPINMTVRFITRNNDKPYINFIRGQENNNQIRLQGTMKYDNSDWYILGNNGVKYYPRNLPHDHETGSDRQYKPLKQVGHKIDIIVRILTTELEGTKAAVKLEGSNCAVQPQASAPVAAAAVVSSTQSVVSQDNAQIPQESDLVATSLTVDGIGDVALGFEPYDENKHASINKHDERDPRKIGKTNSLDLTADVLRARNSGAIDDGSDEEEPNDFNESDLDQVDALIGRGEMVQQLGERSLVANDTSDDDDEYEYETLNGCKKRKFGKNKQLGRMNRKRRARQKSK